MTSRCAAAAGAAAVTLWLTLAANAAIAAPIPVTTTADERSGMATGSGCSLREAIEAAGTNAAYGGCPAGESPAADTLTLDAGSTYALTLAGTGDDANLTGDLDADVADGAIAIEASGTGAPPLIDAAGLDRALDVSGDTSLSLTGLRVTQGSAPFGESGGAIRWLGPGLGDLMLVGTTIDASSAETAGAIDAGTTGTHELRDSTLRGNFSFDLGAVRSSGSLEVVRSLVIENGGGGVVAERTGAGSLLLDSSTVAQNNIGADLSSGGVVADGEATIVNSTISQNTGGFIGGLEVGAPTTISFSTIAENGAPPASGFAAGGIGAEFATQVTLDGVILSGNQVGQGESNCGPGLQVVEGPNPNLEGTDTCGLDTGTGSLIDANADLAPLADNGGPTPTRGLYPGSAALDAGLAACVPAVDQRGVARPGTSPACDLGAFEGSVPRPIVAPPQAPTAPAQQPGVTPPGRQALREGEGREAERPQVPEGQEEEAEGQIGADASRRGARAGRDRPLGRRTADPRDQDRRPRR